MEDKKIKKKKLKINKLIAYDFTHTILKRKNFTVKLLKGKSKLPNDELILKEYKKINFTDDESISKYKMEVEILNKLKGFDLVPYIIFPYQNRSNISIAFKRTNNFINTVDDLLAEKCFNQDQAKFYFANFLHLFEYLIDCNILFRGLDLSDAFINKDNGYIEYFNLSSCKLLNNKADRTSTLINSPRYLSPEMMYYEGYDYRSNYFVMGILLYEFLHNQNPFVDEKDPFLTYKNISTSNFKPINTDRDAKFIIEQLLINDKEKRLGCGVNGLNEITYHKWFLNFNWDLFSLRKMGNKVKFIEPLNIEEYYINKYQNSPEMTLMINMRDRPLKDNEKDLFNDSDSEDKDKDKKKEMSRRRFSFIDDYDKEFK